jgi:predicted Zn-dependent protease
MERTPEIFEKIEGYLTHTMPEDEILAFEKELAINPELQEEVEKHRILHKILSDRDTLDFKEKLMRISATIKEEQSNPSASVSASYWKIAASIAILLGVGMLFWYTYTNQQNSTQDLYSAYYKPFPVEDAMRNSTNNEMQSIIKNYAKKAYDSVAIILEKHQNLDNPLQLYLGNSYLNIGQEEKAVSLFKGIESNGKYYEITKWYLSLTYLKLNTPKKSIPLLKEIITYNGVYKDKATRLLKAVEKI